MRVIHAVAAFGGKKTQQDPHQKKSPKTPKNRVCFSGFFPLFPADKEVYKCVLCIYVYVFLQVAFNKRLLHLRDPPTILAVINLQRGAGR